MMMNVARAMRIPARDATIALVIIGGISLLAFDGTEVIIVSCLLGWAMLAIAITDAHDFIVPDVLSLPAIPCGILVSGLLAEPMRLDTTIMLHLVSALTVAGLLLAIRQMFFVLRKYEGLGLGDVKLAAAAGAWTGPQGVTLVVLWASLGAIVFVLLRRFQSGSAIVDGEKIPFGAFLAPSIWLVWSLIQLGVLPGSP